MQPPVTAVYDANILYPAPLRDLFIRLAQAGLVRGRWTETIHDEWMQNVLANNPALALSLKHRFPYIDPLNHLQVELLRRVRDAGDKPVNERVRRAVYITINGVAAGLRNSG